MDVVSTVVTVAVEVTDAKVEADSVIVIVDELEDCPEVPKETVVVGPVVVANPVVWLRAIVLKRAEDDFNVVKLEEVNIEEKPVGVCVVGKEFICDLGVTNAVVEMLTIVVSWLDEVAAEMFENRVVTFEVDTEPGVEMEMELCAVVLAFTLVKGTVALVLLNEVGGTDVADATGAPRVPRGLSKTVMLTSNTIIHEDRLAMTEGEKKDESEEWDKTSQSYSHIKIGDSE